MFSAFLVAHDPGAAVCFQLVNKGHVQRVQHGHNPAHQASLAVILCLGLHLDSIFLFGGGNHILPDGVDALFQLSGAELTDVLEGIQLQPQKQGFLRQNIVGSGFDRKEGIPEVVEIGAEIPPFLLCPDFIAALAHVA